LDRFSDQLDAAQAADLILHALRERGDAARSADE
jgi:hypothetical protein